MATTKKSRSREWWKAIYRMMRIARRETIKASNDLVVYGTGIVHVDKKGEIKHIPLKDFKW